MGKKSKRNRSSSSHNGAGHGKSPQPPSAPRPRRLDDIDDDDDDDEEEEEVQCRMVHPSLRTAEEETKDNLRFQDPFIEEYGVNGDEEEEDDWEDDDDDEDAVDVDGDEDEVVAMKPKSASRKRDKMKDRGTDDSEMEEVVQTWNPFSKEHQKLRQQQNEVLEMDPTAYKMYHAIQNEWPSLSFDFIYDTYGIARTKFPHTLLLVCGTQADGGPQNNQLTVMKISDLHRIHIDTEDDILGEEINKDDDDDDDDDDNNIDDDDDDIDDEEVDPVMEHYTIPHYGGVNRLRVMQHHYNSNIVAAWSDVGTVNLYNLQSIRQRFLEPNANKVPAAIGATSTTSATTAFYSYDNDDPGVEGFALDWSPIVAGRLATGDCHGSIHLWTPTSNEGGSTYNVSYLYNNVAHAQNHNKNMNTPINSVEDVQWSPTEATVLAAASCDGTVRIFDIRKPGHAMIGHHIHDADVNVLAWNPLVTNLLATGGDDGTLAVWDLRHFRPTSSATKSSSSIQPLARFTPHTTPITSVEWHPTDESMLVASDDIGTYIYDLSVEEDDTAVTNTADVVPPQLLFVHNGSEQFKEVHWHPQITSCVMTTALTGFSVFIPSNL